MKKQKLPQWRVYLNKLWFVHGLEDYVAVKNKWGKCVFADVERALRFINLLRVKKQVQSRMYDIIPLVLEKNWIFNIPLLKTCSLPGYVLSSGNIAVDKTDKNPYFCSACEMLEYENNKHMKNFFPEPGDVGVRLLSFHLYPLVSFELVFTG